MVPREGRLRQHVFRNFRLKGATSEPSEQLGPLLPAFESGRDKVSSSSLATSASVAVAAHSDSKQQHPLRHRANGHRLEAALAAQLQPSAEESARGVEVDPLQPQRKKMKEAQATAIAAAQQMPPDDQVGQSMACVGSEAPGSDVALASHPTPAHSASSPSPQHNQHQQIPVHPKHIVQPVLPDPSQTIVPDHFHYAETSALTHMIADMLQRLTAHNDQIPLSSSTLTRFHSRAPPGISIVDYLRRIVKYASVERVCLLILLVYIDRVCERNRSFTISSLTVHRFIITGVTVACKALCDSFLQNSMYAKVGGISTKELNVLEIEFLTLIGWDLAATAERLQDYYRNLVRQHPGFCMVSHGQVAALRTGPAAGGGEVSVAASAVKEAPAHGSGKDWTGTSAFVEAAEESEAVAMMGQQQQQQQQLEQEDVYSETRYTHGDGEGRHPGGGDVPMIV